MYIQLNFHRKYLVLFIQVSKQWVAAPSAYCFALKLLQSIVYPLLFKYTHKYEGIREQLNALEKVYLSIKSIIIFCWNAFNNGFRDFAFLDLGSGNDYSEHLAFQFESVVPIVSVSIDITLLTKF